MKQNLITATVVAWLLLSPRFPFIANSGTQSRSVGLQQDEQQIREVERQWTEEVVSGDTSVLERIMADDFLGTAPDGKLYTKADAIKDAKSFSSAFESNHLNEARVRFFGDIAVMADCCCRGFDCSRAPDPLVFQPSPFRIWTLN
jgi:Domain of unknown function (DUF4440)